MPRGSADHFTRLDKGGRRRNPDTIRSHRMLGPNDEHFMRGAATVVATAAMRRDTLSVTVVITNDRAGHHIPTDSPLRHMMLLVRASANGSSLAQLNGPTLPAWCGVGALEDGCYGGLPGTVYAKVLEDRWTGASPTGAYWNATRIASDTRIPALQSHRTTFEFHLADAAAAAVDVRLLYRRAPIALQNWKSWHVPDVVMAEQVLFVPEENEKARSLETGFWPKGGSR